MKLEGYTQFGGHHRETAAVQHVLAHQGVTAPHTGQPFTESMLLGIGGGIGFVYFVFEFTSPDFFYQGVFFQPERALSRPSDPAAVRAPRPAARHA
jgi:hypothetical protein